MGFGLPGSGGGVASIDSASTAALPTLSGSTMFCSCSALPCFIPFLILLPNALAILRPNIAPIPPPKAALAGAPSSCSCPRVAAIPVPAPIAIPAVSYTHLTLPTTPYE